MGCSVYIGNLLLSITDKAFPAIREMLAFRLLTLNRQPRRFGLVTVRLVAGSAEMLCNVGRTRENCLNECAYSLKLLANPEQLISFEIEEDHDSMSRMMLPLTFAVL